MHRRSHRLNFHDWIILEERREQLVAAAEEGAEDFPQKVYAYLSVAVPVKVAKHLPWDECIGLFYKIYTENIPNTSIPIVGRPSEDKIGKRPPWDYPGRAWYLYANLLAKAYGWSLEYISNLDIDSAIALVQEVLTDEQLEKEFDWGRSETAYSFDKTTKKSKLIPLKRPYWMLPDISKKPKKKAKILRSLLPVGNVIDVINEAEKTDA